MADSAPQLIAPPRPTAQNYPIDLTGEEDDSDYDSCDRKHKRMCPQSRLFSAAKLAVPESNGHLSHPYHSGLSPAMSHSSLYPDTQPSPVPNRYPQPNLAATVGLPEHSYPLPSPQALLSGSPSSPTIIPRPHMQHQPGPVLAPLVHHTPSMMLPAPSASPSSQTCTPPKAQVIDLTRSPSPSSQSHPLPMQQSPQSPLSADLPPKTPVCIGQLTVTALVLYPVAYLQPQRGPLSPDGDWAPIRMSYEHNGNRPGNTETIHIRTPNISGPSGEPIPGENFGVVEQKVATLLGPMLGKGLIRLDGKVRRGQPNVSLCFCHSILPKINKRNSALRQLPILPLALLVFTPKGNIAVVANYLHQHALYLDHPTLPSDIQRLKQQHYWNPHNPPPGGHSRALFGSAQGGTIGRWNTVSGKSVEVQRSQVDELFKSLRDGGELPESDPRKFASSSRLLR
jgi:SWI/SNF-related matrix-associated actin-dependent regulator of chromatin subfamily A3